MEEGEPGWREQERDTETPRDTGEPTRRTFPQRHPLGKRQADFRELLEPEGLEAWIRKVSGLGCPAPGDPRGTRHGNSHLKSACMQHTGERVYPSERQSCRSTQASWCPVAPPLSRNTDASAGGSAGPQQAATVLPAKPIPGRLSLEVKLASSSARETLPQRTDQAPAHIMSLKPGG